jgi:hypothetical protein
VSPSTGRDTLDLEVENRQLREQLTWALFRREHAENILRTAPLTRAIQNWRRDMYASGLEKVWVGVGELMQICGSEPEARSGVYSIACAVAQEYRRLRDECDAAGMAREWDMSIEPGAHMPGM